MTIDIEQTLDSNERIKAIVDKSAAARYPFNPFMGLANRMENESHLRYMINEMRRTNRLGSFIEGEDTESEAIQTVEKLGLVKVSTITLQGSQFFMQPTEKLLSILEKRCFPPEPEVQIAAPKTPAKKFSFRRLIGLKAA